MTIALPATRRPGLAAGRLLRIELRHNAMMWLLPVVFALFWLTTYRKAMATAPMWNLRAASLQSGTVIDFITPVVGASAWMGSREARRRLTEIVTTSARPPWARLLATWAATACWALAGYLICLAVLYGVTASQASGAGPLWWPVAVAAASVVAFSALGFAAGVLIPSRFTAPIAGIAAFFVLVLSTQLIVGSRSYWQISPIVTGPWDSGPDAGVATFYPYLPDLSVAQLMFLGGLTLTQLAALVLRRASGVRRVRVAAAAVTVAGLLAAGTAVRLAGTSDLDHGMIAIPALHDAANDRPVSFTPDCSHAAIPVCLNPAYARYLPAVTTALRPAINEVAGLPGVPGRISQIGTDYQQCQGNGTAISAVPPPAGGAAPVLGFLLPDQEQGPPLTTSQVAAQVGATTAPALLATVIGDAPGASQAQQAVWAGLVVAAGQRVPAGLVTQVAAGQRGPARSATPLAGASPCESPGGVQALAAGQGLAPQRDSAVSAAARRFAALPAAVRHGWLVAHLPALRAGRITLAQIP
jgi:hypothetical protein